MILLTVVGIVSSLSSEVPVCLIFASTLSYIETKALAAFGTECWAKVPSSEESGLVFASLYLWIGFAEVGPSFLETSTLAASVAAFALALAET